MGTKHIASLGLTLAMASVAQAWNCPTGQHRVQAPTGTPTTAPYYDVVEGIAFICEPDNPTTTSNPSQNQSQTQSQQNQQSQNQTSSSLANSSSLSQVANSGNSSNKNSNKNSNQNTANGGNATADSNSSATNNGNNSNNSAYSESYNEVRQTPMAYSPDILSTSPCIKGFSGGLSFPGGAGSLGLSKVDEGCDSRQTAVIFHGLHNDSAAAKILCSTKAAKRAHLTLEECQQIVIPPAPVVVPVDPSPVHTVVPNVTVPVTIVQPSAAAAETKVPEITYRDFGSCHLTTQRNVCYRILDDALRTANQDNDSKIVLTGPVESGKMLSYLKGKIALNRVQSSFSDEQNDNLNIQVIRTE